MTETEAYLAALNREHLKLHEQFENYFWRSRMGEHSVDEKETAALARRDAFRSDPKRLAKVIELLEIANAKDAARLTIWKNFFEHYQTPPEALEIKAKIDRLESSILKKRATRKEGYVDPKTKKFVEASALKMSMMLRTHEDESVRKACFEGREKLALDLLPEYVQLVGLRNDYARTLGYADFFDFKIRREEHMTKPELFSLFDAIYDKTKYAFDDIRTLEKSMRGLRKPWNFSYFMAGDFTREEDPYFQFGDALMRWGRSFAALGIGYHGGELTLDLLDRFGKWNNGFCHWPKLVHFDGKKRIAGSSNFTCNVVAGTVGSGIQGYNTLFHEGGHAAHMLTAEEREVVLNHEYAPMTMSWAETQSMFLDTLFSGIDWKMRYAKNSAGETYPWELHERKVRKLAPLRPMRMNSIMFVASFEREVYEAKNLTAEKVIAIAKKMYRKYNDMSEDSLAALNIPHIYSWESSAAYYGYGLAELALSQWREYFYTKYGYLVDNPNIGKEMSKVWKLGARHSFPEFVKLATGKKLSAQPFLREVTKSAAKILRDDRAKVERLAKVKPFTKPVQLNASIKMVDGKKVIATNQKSFEDMAEKYRTWYSKKALENKGK